MIRVTPRVLIRICAALLTWVMATPAFAIIMEPETSPQVFVFTGTCLDDPDCSDGTVATAKLTVLSTYMYGEQLSVPPLPNIVLGFEYYSDVVGLLTAQHIGDASGAISQIPGANDVVVSFNTNLAGCPATNQSVECNSLYRWTFESTSSGAWSLSSFENGPNDMGIDGTWSVPEPATLALMTLGIAGIGFTRKKAA